MIPEKFYVLIDLFEDEVSSDDHNLYQRIRRMIVAGEIVKEGYGALQVIREYSNSPEWKEKSNTIRRAWMLVVHWIADDFNIDGAPSAAADYDDWLDWVRHGQSENTASDKKGSGSKKGLTHCE